MPLSDIVNVVITTTAKGVSQAGFGTPLLLAYHGNFAEMTREYDSLAGMVTDGFTVYDPAYRMAQAVLAQTPHPPTFKVGRRVVANMDDQIMRLTPLSTVEGGVYAFNVVSPDGTSTIISYAVGGADTIALIVTALQTQLNAITGLTATDDITHVTCTSDVIGEQFWYQDSTDWTKLNLEFKDLSVDGGIATDLAAVAAADDDWYGLAIDHNCKAQISACQASLEAMEKIASYQTFDTEVTDSGVSDDIASTLQTAAYVRCTLMYSGDHSGYAGAAWLGRMFPQNPGRATWAFKALTGIAVDDLPVANFNNARAKDCNTYERISGVNITLDGRTPDGVFMDITRGRDWLKARLEERIVTLMINNLKVPYTQIGLDMVETQIRAQLRQGQSPSYGFIALDPEFTVTPPVLGSISTTDKANRFLPDVEFEATLQGAIHKVGINGVLQV